MNLEDALQKAMQESLKNAEQWLKDASLILKNEQNVHGFVLLDFAGEEIAKAYACWQVLIGAIPPSHPIVKPNKKATIESLVKKVKKDAKRIKKQLDEGKKPKKTISVFSSHAIKDSLLVDLGRLMHRIESAPLGTEVPSESCKDAMNAMDFLVMLFGEVGAMRRSEWMYVNLTRADKGYEVSSPMELELGMLGKKQLLRQYELDFVKSLASAPTDEFSELAKEIKEDLKERDPFFPE